MKSKQPNRASPSNAAAAAPIVFHPELFMGRKAQSSFMYVCCSSKYEMRQPWVHLLVRPSNRRILLTSNIWSACRNPQPDTQCVYDQASDPKERNGRGRRGLDEYWPPNVGNNGCKRGRRASMLAVSRNYYLTYVWRHGSHFIGRLSLIGRRTDHSKSQLRGMLTCIVRMAQYHFSSQVSHAQVIWQHQESNK